MIIFFATFQALMSDTNNNNSGGFAKTTDFKWLGIGVAIFLLIGFIMPTPQSMVDKAIEVFPNLSEDNQNYIGSSEVLAVQMYEKTAGVGGSKRPGFTFEN